LRACGGFDGTSLADDYEIAYRLHAHHLTRGIDYRIISVADALALTIVPDTLASLYRQRRRWSEGCFQTLLRYRRLAGRARFGGIGIFLLPFKFFVAAENCWGIATLPLALASVLLEAFPIPLAMVLQLVALKLTIDVIVCWILLALHRQHLPPRVALKSLLSQCALVPVYVLLQQLVAFAHIAGIVRSLRRDAHPDDTDSYAAAIRTASPAGKSQLFTE
jgi:cellulose synthase/poly-beta-1,6-N-acetylglucosamine synthase-like glycosyltransferase